MIWPGAAVHPREWSPPIVRDGGDDTLNGEAGDDLLVGGTGNDTIAYTDVQDGGDIVVNFDGTPSGGQDVVNLDAIFDNLGVATAVRGGRVQISAAGANDVLRIDSDGDATYETLLATVSSGHTFDINDVQLGTAP